MKHEVSLSIWRNMQKIKINFDFNYEVCLLMTQLNYNVHFSQATYVVSFIAIA